MVLMIITDVGIENENYRCRQHSMLVIPALLTLKPKVIEKAHESIVELIEAVSLKLEDKTEIVQKTAKKLLLELKRVYINYLPAILEKFNDI